ncbi:hypothetical protein Tco_0895416 [Tanacetum coccineum]|uniref:Ribosomal protein S1 n=1 Tax=Tanacetum coccineum TaxID=301880 RepID=A0ABQ5CKT9_9ASTR
MPTLKRDLREVVKFPRWVEAKVVSSEKTSFLEMESSGSIVVNIPGSSKCARKGEKIGDSSRMATFVSILEEQSK